MISMQFPPFFNFGPALSSRWKLWALFALFSLIAAIGTWITGQYQIGRLDALKSKYDEAVTNYAKFYGDSPNNSLERDLLEACKQAQIGTWLQTTDALRFDSPITGNRISVRLDLAKAFVDLNGREISDCVQDEIEDRQYDIGSMTNTWAIILLLGSFCLGSWAWLCWHSLSRHARGRNIYAETLAETSADTVENPAVDDDPQSANDTDVATNNDKTL